MKKLLGPCPGCVTVWLSISSALDMPTHTPRLNGDAATPRGAWPDNVGIIAMDIYFPAQYVDQVGAFLKCIFFFLICV